MSQRKVWTQEEDRILQEIVEVKKLKKWSSIARCMQADYELAGRTGKQCRERWYNQLDPTISNQLWEVAQQNRLFEIHHQLGNRWTKIALRFPGRTDNNVKNHYYSTLRKGMRRFNHFVSEARNRGMLKQINNVQLSKIIAVSEDKFEQQLPVEEQLRNFSTDIVNKLIELSRNPQDHHSQNICKDLGQKIAYFCQNYKKKRPKKKRRVLQLEFEGENPQLCLSEDEVIPKSRQRISRSILQTLEPAKSENNEEEMPVDFPFEFLQNNFNVRRPCSPLNFSSSFIIPTSFRMSYELPSITSRTVSLQASTGSSMFATLGFCWPFRVPMMPGSQNIQAPKNPQPEPSPLNQ